MRAFPSPMNGESPRRAILWFAFQDERARQRALGWLESEDIAALVEPEPVRESPSLRPVFIAETLAFMRAASQLPGVLRIALLGSLTTAEPDPDDVDLLVTITDDMDVAPLATLGRQLKGHLQQHNRGADIFLADPRGRYLGRTCPWRDCQPGIRQSCDALHCGQRPYVHDDLATIRLDEALIAAPPIELWPQVVVRGPVPADVQMGLLGSLPK
ncbi:MAG: hypothetical protein KKA73_12005 [Chloroflexi bacterium]|nr:hypothetical protein [Chloroflexota bacterium]MBU1748404.1 hypothetical protein [Chloroflexota bacterium]